VKRRQKSVLKMRIISHTGLHPSINGGENIFANSREEPEWTKSAPSIPEFYANQEIFVTGASGFLGKVLVEKLLRSCSDLKAIYILIRPKKGKSIEQRVKDLTALPLFEPLRNHNPDIFKKIIPINGDVAELRMGISEVDAERMKNVSIIFHSAASVRFDDSLRYAVFMNTRGTREILDFARTLPNIKVIMHVSTTYSHPELKTVGEVIHEPYVDWRKTIEICEKYDDDLMHLVTPLYTNFMPNTYTFTKALAEQVVDDNKDELPLILFRPSIVISTMKDPFPGWVDNFNGPVGLLIGSGLGILRTMYCNPDNIADFTPVDVCIKAMIIAAWKRAHEPK
jgi:alcohol-forming fatty acyl-CoA reductase